jgi:hypothetical protein
VPRRDRRSKRAARLTLTLRQMLALDLGPHPVHDHDLTDDLLAEVYFEHRGHLLAHKLPLARAWAYWRYEDGIPESLRATWPTGHIGDREYSEQLNAARAAWLAEHA